MHFCRTCALSPRARRNPVLAAPGHYDYANFMMNPVSWITGCRKGRCTFLERKICTVPALRLGDGPCSARRCRLGKDILGSVHPGGLHQHGDCGVRHRVVLSGRCSRSSKHAHRHPAWSTLFAPVQLSGGYRTEVPTLLTARARMHESRRQFIFQSVAFYVCKMMTDALVMNSGIQMPSSINNRINPFLETTARAA